jgi:DNA-binding response OmpR family regulator
MSDKLVLIVDDKFSVTRLISDYLGSKGYRTITAWDGSQALTEARINNPDIILLDIMMPHMDGFEFIKTYRKESNTPIILLTARVEETDKVVGLGLGADDYVTKPFGMAELVARIKAVLRRSNPEMVQTKIFEFGDLRIDREKKSPSRRPNSNCWQHSPKTQAGSSNGNSSSVNSRVNHTTRSKRPLMSMFGTFG